MDIKVNNSVKFGANLVIRNDVIQRIPKHFNIERIQQQFVEKTNWYAKDMFLTARKNQIIATLDKDDKSADIIGMLNIEEMTDENLFIKKMLYSYRIIMQKLKLNNLIKNRQNFSEKAYEGALQRGFKILDRLGGEFPDLCCNAILMKYNIETDLKK